MTALAAPGSRDVLAPFRSPAARLAVAAGLVALGDWIAGGPIGSVLLLFILGVALAAAITNRWRADARTSVFALAALGLGALPLVEDVDVAPIVFAYAGLAVFALLLAGQGTPGWARKPLDALLLLATGPGRLLGDGLRAFQAAADRGGGRLFSVARLAGWIVPIGLLGVFALLFADANPILARWLVSLDPAFLLKRLDPGRLLFWFLVLLIVWPFLHVRLAAAGAWRPGAPASAAPADPAAGAEPASVAPSLRDLLLGREAIARSLVLFNLLFAVQTVLDATYLWGGVELPAGMTYASYAHRGAYPLIVTALLAAAFMLIALRPGGPAEGSRLLRGLVHLFVAQNVGLVLSSILRLDLYVSVYSLTYWRVAAFVWMGLVAAGLVLIGVRIALGLSNRWLVGANLAAAAATLYACCFVNVAALIAEFNVSHQAAGDRLDLPYLVSLGPQALPAIDRALPKTSPDTPVYYGYGPLSRRTWLVTQRGRLATQHAVRMQDKRAWTLRGLRLSRYLAEHEARLAIAPPLPPEVSQPEVQRPDVRAPDAPSPVEPPAGPR